MKRIFSVLVLVLLALPITLVEAQPSSRADFCGRRQERQSAIKSAFEKKNQAYQGALELQQNNTKARRQRFDSSLKNIRETADTRRQEAYQKIEQNLTTEQEKTEMQKFVVEVEGAVDVRRMRFDEARQTFRETVDDLLKDRVKTSRSSTSSFKDKVEELLSGAETKCGATDQNEARGQNITKELIKARSAYVDKLKTRGSFQESVGDAARVRGQAFQSAINEFQKSMQTIRQKYSSLD